MRFSLLLLALMGAAPLASATDYTVTTWSELNNAWSIAQSGDRILIPANTTIDVPETLDFEGRAITVMGLDDQTSVLAVSNGPVPIGWSGNRIFDFTSGEKYDSYVHDLVLRGRQNLTSAQTLDFGGLVYVKSWVHELDPTIPGGPQVTIDTYPRFERVTFEEARVATKGGAARVETIALSENGAPPIVHPIYKPTLFESCVFRNNRSNGNGGALSMGGGYAGPGSFNETGARAELFDCRFISNQANEDGGAMHIGGAVVGLTDCLFEGNSVTQPWGNGSALIMANSVSLSRLSILNSTFAGNIGQSVIWQTSHIQNPGLSGELVVKNSIVWGNTSTSFSVTSIGAGPGTTAPIVSYSDVAMASGTYPGAGNINSDPAFTSGRYLDQLMSPCIDAGDPQTAQAGRQRAKTTSTTNDADLGTVDMGYHYLGANNPRYFGVANLNTNGQRATIDFTGSPIAGAPATINLRGAIPSSLAALVYGFDEQASAFAQGTLWVTLLTPTSYFLGTTDAMGAMDLSVPTNLPPGFDVYVQYLYADTAQGGTYSLTEGMEIVLQ